MTTIDCLYLVDVVIIMHNPSMYCTGGGLMYRVVVSVVGRINEVNQHRARLVHDG